MIILLVNVAKSSTRFAKFVISLNQRISILGEKKQKTKLRTKIKSAKQISGGKLSPFE